VYLGFTQKGSQRNKLKKIIIYVHGRAVHGAFCSVGQERHITLHCREGADSASHGRARHISRPNRGSGRLAQAQEKSFLGLGHRLKVGRRRQCGTVIGKMRQGRRVLRRRYLKFLVNNVEYLYKRC
jgi:hypothetical protein